MLKRDSKYVYFSVSLIGMGETRGKNRVVRVPVGEFDAAKKAAEDQYPSHSIRKRMQVWLDLVYYYGQNEVQSSTERSVCAGDVIYVGSLGNDAGNVTYWLITPRGFVNMCKAELKLYKIQPPHQRLMYMLTFSSPELNVQLPEA